jgi:hypothetical protein
MILKIVLKACHNIYNGENQPMREKKRQNRNYYADFGKTFRISDF